MRRAVIIGHEQPNKTWHHFFLLTAINRAGADLICHEQHALGRGDKRLEAQVEGGSGQAAAGGPRGGCAGVDERVQHGWVGLRRVGASPGAVGPFRAGLRAPPPHQRPELTRVHRPVPDLWHNSGLNWA